MNVLKYDFIVGFYFYPTNECFYTTKNFELRPKIFIFNAILKQIRKIRLIFCENVLNLSLFNKKL
jgi:hypothetical protein